MKALIISADNFEDSELLVPYYRLKEEGIEVDVATPDGGTIRGKHGYEVKADLRIADADPSLYDLLVLPGGKAPETVRRDAAALAACRRFFEEHKPVAAICHGPQTLISAGLVKGRRATCYRTVADEMREAGALYEDSEVVIDGNLVTSRQPADLPAFLREMMRFVRRR
ncbi:MAG TPA: type 1 glutamine amidotransferase domain-containing protein [Geobacteraceae bacterium]